MSTRFYDTDLTDAAWAFSCAGSCRRRDQVGDRRTTNLRAVLNAIFYLLRTGCQWRLLPREPAGTSDRRVGALLLGGLSALFPRIRTVIS